KIGTGNPKVIEALIQLLDKTQDESTRRRAAESFEKIDPGNPKVIEALIELLQTTQDESTRRRAAYSLEEIGTGNPKVIEALIELLQTTQDEFTRRRAAESLEKIDSGNPKVIEALIELLDRTQDEFTRRRTAESLEKIGTGNPKVIEALIQLLGTTRNVPARQKAAAILEKIGIGNPKAIAGLRNLQHHRNPYTRLLVTELLPKITTLTQSQTQQIEDDLLLFLQETRVKDTVDRYFSTNNPKKAKFCYHRIIACLDKLQEGRDIITRRSLLNSYLDIYQQIVNFSIKIGDLNRAFFYTELFRNRYLVERIAQQFAPLPNTVTPELSAQINQAKVTEKKQLQDYTNGINQNLDEQQLKQLEFRWQDAKKALETLYEQVAVIEPEFIAKTKVSPLSFRQIQSVLPSDTAILEFFFTANKLLTLLILPGAKSPESIPVKLNPKSIAALAQAWVSGITTKTPSKEKEDINATIQTLSEQINQISDSLNLSTLLPHIPAQIQNLIIVPHKYLHLFPLHALWLNDHQRLIDRFAVSYFPNLQTWKICQNRQRSRHSLMGIENPTQDKDLIFAKAEMASIRQRQQFIHRKIFPGKQASKAEILHSATDTHCFHFSGHAEYNFQNPLDSYLMLSENSEENLTLNTIFADLHIPQADLVTLSACCTGVVDAFQPLEEYLGLPTGFLLAGAKAVIGSQWKVNSIATAFIFDEFYRQLEQTGNKAIALKNAQNWLRRCTADELRERASTWDLSKLEPKEKFRLQRTLKRLSGTPFENPYYWAAFILTGC
ncbi:MAG: CHAT domain-containing protein, partial [Coleofasciculus sp.]|uniref:CHAT domain-containing protein n=1 Tax=Coleofasciculus sp. TaxID=3100458 RepID=UPI003A226E80